MPRGGKRAGAGRPAGSGPYGEPTKAIRVPQSKVKAVLSFVKNGGQALPLYASKVAAGFPSPADDYLEGTLDLNEHLVRNPAATFFVRVSGDSMIGSGIFPDDILIVDRSLEAKSGDVVIAVLDNELTVKQYHRQDGTVELRPDNPAYEPIHISGDMELHIWGVVKHVIHAV